MNRPFNSWKVGAPYFVPVLALGLGALFVPAVPFGGYIGGVFLALGLFTLNFFRDPQRAISQEPADIVSPADGLVVEVAEISETPYYEGPCKRISIFLNVFNVHINRVPDDCTITRIEYKKGKYKNAMSAEAGALNEANALWLDTPHGPMTVRQIAGLIARRIVCVCEEGAVLSKGEKFGMIKFGSRTELYLPLSAAPCVKIGDKVEGGASVLARIAE